MQLIPLQAVPSQQLQIVLAGQNCQISVYAKTTGIYVDLNVNGSDLTVGTIARDGAMLVPGYSGFIGNLMIGDTQGNSDPTYDGLGGRYQLAYFTAADLG